MNHSSGRHRRSSKARDARKKSQTHLDAAMSAGVQLKTTFNPLSESDIQKIHGAALELLSTVGMGNPTPKISTVALANGCRLSETGRLLFPPSLIEDTLVKAAGQFVIHGRNPAFDFEARSGNINFCTGGAAVSMLDIDQRRYRPSTLKDLYDAARISNTLKNIHWFTRPLVATDIDDTFDLDVNTIYACAAGTQKHIATSITQGEHVHRILPLLDLLSGGDARFAKRPFCTVHATTVVSPMNFAEDSLDVVCAAIEIGMPIHCQTGPQAGATAPAALAGTLAQGCAETLASLTVINLLKPGHPVVLGNWVFVSDLRTGAFSGGGGEQALLGAASGQMSRFYGIPGGMGAGMTDSKLPDNQAGFEKALTLVLASLSGGGFVYESAGMLASLLGCSFESMLIDDDMLSSIRRIARGIEVNDDTLSVSVIGDAVSGAGHFLGQAQTLELMESEYVYPRYADRSSPSDWQDSGATDVWDRATDRARHILSSHYPQCIDTATDTMIRDRFNILLPSQM